MDILIRDQVTESIIREYLESRGCEHTLNTLGPRSEEDTDENRKQYGRLFGSKPKKKKKKKKERKEWSEKEIRHLKRAIKSKKSDNKKMHWEDIANLVGRSKRECYDMYKKLKASKKKKKKKKEESTESRSPEREQPEPSKPEPFKESSTTIHQEEESRTLEKIATVKPLQVKRCGWTSEPLSRETLETTKKSNDRISVSTSSSSSSTTSFETFMKTLDTPLKRTATQTTSLPTKDMIMETNLEFENLDDFEIVDDKDTITSATTASSPVDGNNTVSKKMAQELHAIFFGKEKQKMFPKAWLEQGFHFSKCPDLGFGLVQNDGGPCGPLAVVQAYVLDYMFREKISDWQNPSENVCSAALRYALCTILWQAGTNRGHCVVAIEKTGKTSKRVNERLVLRTCRTRKDLETYLESETVWKQFTASRGRGVILLAYSAVLSRGLRETRDDMASVLGETPQMMGRHDYASQELVNLLLVGGAFSQVFDGEKRLEGQSKEDTVLLRGIPKRSRIGFLTLFEHYGYVQVGNRLKSPLVPIWVVCSESHYSVLFSDVNRGEKDDGKAVHLFYYDELANQDETIHLTVSLNAGIKDEFKHGEDDEEDLIPPLDRCIRTKWRGASVDWNGTEAIL